MGYNNEEKTVNLKRMAITCLKSWRVILIAMIIGAVLSGGISFLWAPKIIEVDQAVIDANQEQIDQNDSLLNQYNAAKEILDHQRSNLATYEELLKEAIKLKDSSHSEVDAELLSQISSFTEKITSAKINIIELEIGIENYKKQIKDIIEDAEESMSLSIQDEYDDVADTLERLNEELEERNASMEPYVEQRTVKNIAVKILVGIVLGAMVVVGIVAVKFIFNKKIDSIDSVRECYRLPVLANLYCPKDKRRTGIDRMLKKWAGEALEIDSDAEHALIAAKLQAICPDESAEIMLCSADGRDIAKALGNGIRENLGGTINLIAIGNPVRDAEAALAVKDAAVVLVAKINTSRYEEISETIEQLALSKANILGFILI